MNQLNFFDESGAPHADIYCGMVQNTKNPNRFRLNDMQFLLMPANKHEGASVALSVLKTLSLDKTSPWKHMPWKNASWDPDPTEVEIWDGIVIVTFRLDDDEDGGIVHLTRANDRFAMSLPHVDQWAGCGLRWIYRRKCCWLEERNPTPWFGKACNCPSPKGMRP